MSNMDRYTLLIVFTLGCANALSQKEWRAAILETYADATIAMNAGDYQRMVDHYTDDCSEMAPGQPAMSKQEYSNALFNKKDIARFHGYLGFEDLLLWDENFALDRNNYYAMQNGGVFALTKGLRLFVVEQGQVKIKVSLYNRNVKD